MSENKPLITSTLNLRQGDRIGTIFLGLVALLGVAVMMYQTRNGPGVGGDSVQYVMGARNLIDGVGYSRFSGAGNLVPITGFPPFYPFVLAVIGWLGLDMFNGASLLNALFFGGSILLAGLLIKRATRSSTAASIGSLLIFTSTTLLKFHGMVMTEAIYIFIMLLTIYLLVRYLASNRLILLILIAGLIGAATLARYVGLSLLATAILSILLFSSRDVRRRLLDCVLLSVISIAPLFFWFRRNALVGGSLTNRVLIFHLMRPEVLRSYVAEVLSWFIPRNVGLPRAIRNILVILIAVPAPLVFVYREIRDGFFKGAEKHDPRRNLPWILIFYVFFYLGILVANSTLLDAATTLSAIPRYLAPVFVATVLLFVMIIHQLVAAFERGSIPVFSALGYGVFLILLYGISSVPQVRQPDLVYWDYVRKRAAAVEELETINPEAPIITNNQELIYLMSGRSSYMWPILFDPYRQVEREDYQVQLEATKEKLNQGGVMVVFGWPLGTEELVFDALETERLEIFIDITFLGYPETQAE
jgi:hypothetical protein